jgi:hypothetical protein
MIDVQEVAAARGRVAVDREERRDVVERPASARAAADPDCIGLGARIDRRRQSRREAQHVDRVGAAERVERDDQPDVVLASNMLTVTTERSLLHQRDTGLPLASMPV